MKTYKIRSTVAVAALMAASGVYAAELNNTSGLIYNDLGNGPALHSYPSPIAETAVKGAQLVYVSTSNGPALYSYPRSKPDVVTNIKVAYVSNAYGPAIYSYPNNNPKPAPDFKLKLSALKIQ